MTQKKSKVDTLTLKPSEVATAIRAMIPTKRAAFVWGPPGISKSATAKQVATQTGVAFVDVRLSQMDPTDLRGIPYPVIEGGVHGVKWSAPLTLPRNIDYSDVIEIDAADSKTIKFYNPMGKNGIYYCPEPKIAVRSLTDGAEARIVSQEPDRVEIALFNGDAMVPGKIRIDIKGKVKALVALEEFNSAAPSVQAAAYELILDRSLGEYIVPDDVYMVAMGNRDTDKGVTFKMPTPVMNRFVHIEMSVNFDDWQRWALLSRVNPDVVGYLTAFKHQLFDFEPGSASRGFATPRSWEFVSDILNHNDDLPELVMLGLVSGSVGDGTGIQFIEFRKIAADLPAASDVLSGKLKKMPKKVEVALAYALTTTLCYELKERADEIKRKNGQKWASSEDRQQWLKEADHFLEFMMENFQPEICIMGARAAIAIHKLPFDTQKMKHFDTFTDKYRSLIMG